jgi:hypothetical protein
VKSASDQKQYAVDKARKVEEKIMHISLILVFVMLLLARPFGQWRANAWLKALASTKGNRKVSE